MRTIKFEDLHRTDLFNYKDNDLMMMDSIARLDPSQYENVRLGFVSLFYCQRGRMLLSVDGHSHSVRQGDVLLLLPGHILNEVLVTPNTELRLLTFPPRVLDKAVYLGPHFWREHEYALRHPVITLSEEQKESMDYHFALMLTVCEKKTMKFRQESMHTLFKSVVFFLINCLDLPVDDRAAEDSHDADVPSEALDDGKTSRQGQILFREFKRIVVAGGGRVRSVQDVADQLNITPKYLSKVVKEVSGRKPIEHIHEEMVKTIRHELRYSDKSIKEISNALDFPNTSFFGRFVKQHLGTTPGAVRLEAMQSPRQ